VFAKMTVNGGLQSALPAHGLSESELGDTTTSNNEDINELPNEAANIVVVQEDGHRVSLEEAEEANSAQDTVYLSSQDALGQDNDASVSQTTLTPSNNGMKGASEKGRPAGSVHDVERQLELVDGHLPDAQEAKLSQEDHLLNLK
jgi:hypothetical protein